MNSGAPEGKAVPAPLVVPLEKTEGAIKNGHSRDTGNKWHTRHGTKTNKTVKNTTQHRKLKAGG